METAPNVGSLWTQKQTCELQKRQGISLPAEPGSCSLERLHSVELTLI